MICPSEPTAEEQEFLYSQVAELWLIDLLLPHIDEAQMKNASFDQIARWAGRHLPQPCGVELFTRTMTQAADFGWTPARRAFLEHRLGREPGELGERVQILHRTLQALEASDA